jgi:hypothetical protein
MKVRAQNHKSGRMSYKNEFKRVYKHEGFQGFTKGYSGMLLRDGPGFAMHFCLFDIFKRRFGVDDEIIGQRGM